MNIPNGITVFRIFLVPVVFWLILADSMRLAFYAFLLAGLSDALDGFLAKRYGWQTELGAYLDPIADKALLVCIYVALGYFGHLPAWLVIAIVSRDLLIIGAFLLSWIMDRPLGAQPLMISKLNTGLQIALAALVLGNLGFGLALFVVIDVLVWVVGGLTLASAAAYLIVWLRHMAAAETPAAAPDKAAYQQPKVRMPRGGEHAHGP